MGNFEQKVAIVMGASTPGGMGDATARMLADKGAKVVVSGLGTPHLEKLAQEISGLAYEADITSDTEVKGLVDFTLEKHGRLDLGVNHAGSSEVSAIRDITEEHLTKMTQINYYGTVWFIKHVAEKIVDGGAIVTTSSMSGRDVTPGTSAYGSAKLAGDHLVRQAAVEYRDKRLRINAVIPSATDTGMFREGAKKYGLTFEEFAKPFVDLTPLGRIAKPRDISVLVCMMLDDEYFETGQLLYCTGGNSLQGHPRQ